MHDARYDTSHIEVLDGREAVRKRPGMWVGSVGERGLHCWAFGVTDWVVDEALAGRAGSVAVTLTPDGGVRVTGDGQGVPVEAAGHTGGPGIEALLTSMPAEAELSGRYATTVRLFANGLFVANALSSRLTAEVRRGDGVRWVQEYARGVAVAPPSPVGPATGSPVGIGNGIGSPIGIGSGTIITFRPDADIFETTHLSYAVLAEHFRRLAFLNRGLDVTLTDERPKDHEPRSERFQFPGGAADFVTHLDRLGAGTPSPQPDESGHAEVFCFERADPRMAGTVEVAVRWCGSHEERVRSFANSRPTPEGGTHESGFRAGTAAAVDAYARRRGLLTAAEPGRLTADRIGEGLTAVVSVKLERPEFEGATRGGLAGDAVHERVAAAVTEHLGTWLDEEPERGEAVVRRMLEGASRS
ncbi:DNA gyrase subunit B [Streptomyces sp. NPDC059786]|uniref:DNA gyrase subunit B n=1 Tax=Streptomyces sp. NPDC059786 TaxID=3346946 RepID=UPI00365DFB69